MIETVRDWVSVDSLLRVAPYLALVWIALIVMVWIAGWHRLARQFPDRRERAIMTLSGQSGLLGSIRMRIGSGLRFGVCPSGLRVGIATLMSPFARNIFVPWEALSVERKIVRGVDAAVLTFGDEDGLLVIRGTVANRLARAAGDNWPEAGPFPREAAGRVFGDLAMQLTFLVATLVGLYVTLPAFRDAVAAWPVTPDVLLAVIAAAFALVSIPALVTRLRY